jgi:hypothetical protein
LAEEAVEGKREPTHLSILGFALYRAGRHEEALRRLEEGVVGDGDFSER